MEESKTLPKMSDVIDLSNEEGSQQSKEIKRRSTLTRKDVVQKTTFRALRKEYEHYFDLFLKSKGLKTNYDSSKFKTYLNMFVEYVMQWENLDQLQAQFGEFKHLKFIIGLMVDFCKSKKVKKKKDEIALLDQFYDVLYKYSHAKFDRVLDIPEVKFLFRKMLSEDYVDTFIGMCLDFFHKLLIAYSSHLCSYYQHFWIIFPVVGLVRLDSLALTKLTVFSPRG